MIYGKFPLILYKQYCIIIVINKFVKILKISKNFPRTYKAHTYLISCNNKRKLIIVSLVLFLRKRVYIKA